MLRKKHAKRIYLDYAAGAPLDASVFDAMQPFLTTQFGNPSALYKEGVTAREAVDTARKQVAELLQTQPASIVFTSGGTESINMALLGTARAHKKQGRHIITSAIEHHAVLSTMKQLETEGFDVTYLPVDEQGNISVKAVESVLRDDTILVSLMYGNNEIGSIFPIADIGRTILKHRKKAESLYPLFHVDACQATNYLPLAVEALHVDLLSFNGSKISGPKGSGVLYIRKGVSIESTVYGGGQEFGLRSGTEDVASIVGLGAAARLLGQQDELVAKLRNYLWDRISKDIPDVVLNGPNLEDARLPNNLNVSFLGADAEALILYLDKAGIAVSSGSACTTDSDSLSHVLKACGYDDPRCSSSLRMTLGRTTTKKDIDRLMRVLPDIVKQNRHMNATV